MVSVRLGNRISLVAYEHVHDKYKRDSYTVLRRGNELIHNNDYLKKAYKAH